jgi:hypothetical protein
VLCPTLKNNFIKGHILENNYGNTLPRDKRNKEAEAKTNSRGAVRFRYSKRSI